MDASAWRSWALNAPESLLRRFQERRGRRADREKPPQLELELHEPGHYDIDIHLEED